MEFQSWQQVPLYAWRQLFSLQQQLGRTHWQSVKNVKHFNIKTHGNIGFCIHVYLLLEAYDASYLIFGNLNRLSQTSQAIPRYPFVNPYTKFSIVI